MVISLMLVKTLSKLSNMQNSNENSSFVSRLSNHASLDPDKANTIAYKLLTLYGVLLKELESMDFSTQEYLKNASSLIKSVALTYPKQEFRKLLSIMLEEHPALYSTKFYIVLITLRHACCLESINGFPGFENLPSNLLPEVHTEMADHATIFFMTHFTLNFSEGLD